MSPKPRKRKPLDISLLKSVCEGKTVGEIARELKAGVSRVKRNLTALVVRGEIRREGRRYHGG